MKESERNRANTFKIYLLALVSIFLFTQEANAKTFCVSTAADLQSALTEAAGNTEIDTVRIIQGTYNGNFLYSGVNSSDENLSIEGGYLPGCGARVVDPSNTVLDAGSSGTVLALSKSSGALRNFRVEGLTIQNGKVTGIRGAGLHITALDGTITLVNNIITRNQVVDYAGGGIYLFAEVVNLDKNIISFNECLSDGGGFFADVREEIIMTDNIIKNNTASRGGGFYFNLSDNSIIAGNVIIDNIATKGAGAYFETSANVTLVNNLINNNFANNEGGGVYFHVPLGVVVLTNNTISDNVASNKGGGISVNIYDGYTAKIYNNVILNNASTIGKDLYLDNDFNGNRIPASVELYNNDFDQSETGTYIKMPFTIDPSNLDNANPLFVDPASGDYHLTAGSPCKDTGNNSAPEITSTDLDGNPRIMNGIVDMGAYEYPGYVNRPPVADAGIDETFECADATGTSVTLDGSNSSDPDSTPRTNDDIISFEWFEDVTPLGSGETLEYTFSLGVHTVTLVVTDSFGETDTDEVIITVVDTTPPDISLSVNKNSLWPPNRKMVDVGFSYSISDNCNEDPDVSITVTSDEPTATAPGTGGERFAPDAEILSDESVLLRAERSKTGDGRVYMITVEATDDSGNTSTQGIPVKVNLGTKTEAVDSGQAYDATQVN